VVRVKKTGEATTVVHVHYDEQDQRRYVEVHAYPVRNESGTIVHVIEYAVDITERKRSGGSAREAHSRAAKRANPGRIVDRSAANLLALQEDPEWRWRLGGARALYFAPHQRRFLPRDLSRLRGQTLSRPRQRP